MLREVTVSIPPLIADLPYTALPNTVIEMERALREVVNTDAASGGRLSSLGQFLIRTESVASSKIEDIEASMNDYARALAGIKSKESAVSMVQSTNALQQLVDDSGEAGRISLRSILDAHEKLMANDPVDGRDAGMLRTVQNWIGGSDFTPRDAVHVPPPPETVPMYMDDLISFANRDDVPAIAQAAIAHAQFESIHPFTDGNGRIGRALINAILRRREFTTRTVVPIASAMVAQREHYFDLVNNYRTGELEPFVEDLAISAQVASRAAQESAKVLEELPAEWAQISRPRRGSAAEIILSQLLDHPVLTIDDAERLAPRASTSSVYEAMVRLEKDGILHEVTARKRHKVWAASLVMDELDELDRKIGNDIRVMNARKKFGA